MRDPRIAIAAAAVIALAVLFLVVRPDDDAGGVGVNVPNTTAPAEPPTLEPGPTTTRATTPNLVRATIVVRGGKPVGGLARIEARKGMRLLLVVRSDVTDHVHVHGYDVFADVAPGRPATIRLRTRLVGRFEIELEDRHSQIAQLTVTP